MAAKKSENGRGYRKRALDPRMANQMMSDPSPSSALGRKFSAMDRAVKQRDSIGVNTARRVTGAATNKKWVLRQRQRR